MTEQEVLEEAARAFVEAEKLKQQQADMEFRLRTLCRQWGDTAKVWGAAPHHLRRACIMRGLL